MFLINSKIVSEEHNIFWEDLPQSWHSLTPRFCLVLTQPYQQNGLEEQTLIKMLGACKLSPDQYHILPLEATQQIAWHKLRDHLKPTYILLLGINPASLGISALFRLHDGNQYDGCTFIPALSLEQMEQHPEAKKEFWLNGLKPVFAP